jgi:hypothetical protein
MTWQCRTEIKESVLIENFEPTPDDDPAPPRRRRRQGATLVNATAMLVTTIQLAAIEPKSPPYRAD